MAEIVYCKDCAYAEPNNLDAYNAVKLGVFCTRYRQNTAEVHGCDNGKPKQKTNADRVRSMNDVELAIWYCRNRDCIKCPHGKGCRAVGDGILDWLKQEVE